LYLTTYTSLSQEINAVLWNALGQYNPAWDLITDSPLMHTDNENDMDMFNTTTHPGLPPYHFEKAWMSLNGTRFLKANYVDYYNARYADIVDVFSGATPANISIFASASIGDIFIADLRGNYNFVLMKINQIYLTDSIDNHNDRILFSYKKP